MSEQDYSLLVAQFHAAVNNSQVGLFRPYRVQHICNEISYILDQEEVTSVAHALVLISKLLQDCADDNIHTKSDILIIKEQINRAKNLVTALSLKCELEQTQLKWLIALCDSYVSADLFEMLVHQLELIIVAMQSSTHSDMLLDTLRIYVEDSLGISSRSANRIIREGVLERCKEGIAMMIGMGNLEHLKHP